MRMDRIEQESLIAKATPSPYHHHSYLSLFYRSSIDSAVSSYVKDHYPGGVSSVFTVIKPPLSAQAPSTKTNTSKPDETTASAESKESTEEEVQDNPVEAVEASEAVEQDQEIKEAVEEEKTKEEEVNPEDEYQGSDGEVKFVIHVVGSKNNLNNFW